MGFPRGGSLRELRWWSGFWPAVLLPEDMYVSVFAAVESVASGRRQYGRVRFRRMDLDCDVTRHRQPCVAISREKRKFGTLDVDFEKVN